MSVPYRGCLIDPKIYELRDVVGFSVDLWVFDCRRYTDNSYFMKPHTFATKEQAMEAAIQNGRRAVDLYLR